MSEEKRASADLAEVAEEGMRDELVGEKQGVRRTGGYDIVDNAAV